MNVESAILHLKKDAILAKVIEIVPPPVISPTGNVYVDLLDAIVSQQLSIKAASTIFNRFLALFPENDPTPDLLLAMEPDLLRSAGLSNQKANYLKHVAAFARAHDLQSYAWDTASDTEIIRMLTQIKGVGQWSAEMILMFTLGRPDVFPVDDLGIQQSIINLFQLTETGKALQHRMIQIAEPWRPYRTLACRYLWRWKDIKPN